MSHNNVNLPGTDETPLSKGDETGLSDQSDDSGSSIEPEDSDKDGGTEVANPTDEGEAGVVTVPSAESPAVVVVDDEWKIASLPFEVTIIGGAYYWNSWRKSQPEKIRLDSKGERHVRALSTLSEFNLSGMNLSEYDLTGKSMVCADFSGSLLRGTTFNGSDLRQAKFKRADLTDADFSETRLSGAIIDEETIFHTIRSTDNVTVGINGIYVRRTEKGIDEELESAALMTLIPAGDSMKGNNSEAVMENLKHARQLHTGSVLMVTIVTVILIFPSTPDIQMPVLSLKLPIGTLSIIAMIIAMVDQFLVLNHVRDAADGAKYLQTREDAMKIALFPWGISNYPGRRPGFVWDVRQLVIKFNDW